MQHYNQGYDELYHYGVLGMKWGKRKTNPTKTYSDSDKKRIASDLKDHYNRDQAGNNGKNVITSKAYINKVRDVIRNSGLSKRDISDYRAAYKKYMDDENTASDFYKKENEIASKILGKYGDDNIHNVGYRFTIKDTISDQLPNVLTTPEMKKRQSDLYHTGVLGMKWGRRKSGSKTADGKSQHRQKLETKYKNKGLSEQDATTKVNNIYVGRAVVGTIAGATVINIVKNKIMVDAGRKITGRVMDYLNDMPVQDIDWSPVGPGPYQFKTDYMDRLG